MADKKAGAGDTVVIKKYANRRLYNTATSAYVTLEDLARMVREGTEFVVFDAKSNDDLTRQILTQIIFEEESRGEALLPVQFLRQLIGFYGNSMQSVVPKYLEQAMGAFAVQQDQMRRAVESTMGTFIPPSLQEVGRQNMAMMERAMSLFSPFLPGEPETPRAPASPQEEEIAALRREVDLLRKQLAEARLSGKKE